MLVISHPTQDLQIYKVSSDIPEDSESLCSTEEDEEGGRLDMEGGCALLAGGCGPGKTRRRRTAFTSEQLLELEKEFHSKKYLSLSERSQIAHNLRLSEVQVRGVGNTKHSRGSEHLCFR